MTFRDSLFRVARLAMAVAWLMPAQPAHADTKSEFLSRYSPAAGRLQAFYRHVRIVAQSKKTNWRALNGPQTTRLIFESNGPLMRLESTVIESHQASLPVGMVHVVVANPRSSFVATRPPGQDGFVLRDLSPNSAEFDEQIRWRESLAAAPYQFRDLTILDFFKLPDLQITSTQERQNAGEVEFAVSYNLPGSGQGTFIFLPEKSWALREYRIGGWDRKIIQYGDSLDGVPLLKRIEAWQEYSEGKSNVETIEIEEIEPSNLPEERFTLNSVGIADVGPEVGRGYGLALLAVGAFIVLAAVLLLRRTGRSA